MVANRALVSMGLLVSGMAKNYHAQSQVSSASLKDGFLTLRHETLA